MSDLRAELQESIDISIWEWLEPHIERDALIVVAPELALADVGVALANNQTTAVQHWIAEQLISKPTPAQQQAWTTTAGLRFTTLIVQPYVLIQPIGSTNR
jgi:hypothetical protein